MENTHDTDDWGEEMDSSEHGNTYNLFLGLIKWGSVAVTAILGFLLFFVYFQAVFQSGVISNVNQIGRSQGRQNQ